MSQAAVVYWSGTGHTEAMAQAVAAAPAVRTEERILLARKRRLDGFEHRLKFGFLQLFSAHGRAAERNRGVMRGLVRIELGGGE